MSKNDISLTTAARLLKLDEERVSALVGTGFIITSAPGRTTIPHAVLGYIVFLKAAAVLDRSMPLAERVRLARDAEAELQMAWRLGVSAGVILDLAQADAELSAVINSVIDKIQWVERNLN